MTRVFGYCRISTAQQADGDGIPRQRDCIKAFCALKGWSVVRMFSEQQTGDDFLHDRKELNCAVELCGDGASTDVKTIVVERVDRIGRDLIVCELFFRECREKGILVYAADSGEELVNATGDPTRTLIRQILGALAQWDKTQISRKLTAGRRRKARETGKPCGGPPPYGKCEDPVKRAEELKVIELIIKWRDLEDSWDKIGSDLQRVGILNPSGGVGWSKGTLHYIYHCNKLKS